MGKQNRSKQPNDAEGRSAFLRALESVPSLRFIGWGFLLSWGTVSTFTNVLAEEGVRSFQAYWLANMAFTAGTLFLIGAIGSRLFGAQNESGAMKASCILITLSTLLVITLPSETAGVAAQGVAGALSGIGMALGTMGWGLYYSSLDAKEIESYTVFSVGLMIACYTLCLIVPKEAAIVLLLCFPVLSLGCFLLCTAPNSTARDEHRKTAADKDVGNTAMDAFVTLKRFRGFFRIGLGISITSMCISSLWSLFDSDMVALDKDLFALSLLSGAAVAIVLALYCITYARKINLDSLYRWAIPLVVLSFFLVSIGDPAASFGGSLCCFAAQMALDVLTLIYFCEFSGKHKEAAHAIIAFGRFFLEGGILLGILAANLLTKIVLNRPSALGSSLLLLATLLVAAAMISMTDRGKPVFSRSHDEEAFKNDQHAEGEENPLGPKDVEALAKALFQRKCDAVAEQYLLSNREREVLALLAEGRSLPYIRNELFISKSTTGTHVSHIYAKLDVHSKEDLIELVEQCDLEQADT